jgi:anti-sigma factor RsiW
MMSERLVKDLHAYYDGELRGLRRWWLERRIAANPAAQAELARLREVGAALRTQAEQMPAPDLWSAIVMQLPPAVPQAARERDGFGFTLPKWAGAAVAAGAVAVAFLLMPGSGPTPGPAFRGSAVQLLDTGRRPAVILQDDAEATIILLLPKQKIEAGGMSDAVG